MFIYNLMKMFYQANSDGGQSAANNGSGDSNQNNADNQQGEPVTYKTFDEWYASLDENGKKLAAPGKQHFDAVYGTIKDVRKERDDFAKQVRDASKKLEAGSEQQKQLDKLATDLEGANKRADFMEEAISNECKNPKAAFAIATTNDLFTKTGLPDWKAIREMAPELFGNIQSKSTQRKTAGAGTNQQSTVGQSMNNWIREQAGANQITENS